MNSTYLSPTISSIGYELIFLLIGHIIFIAGFIMPFYALCMGIWAFIQDIRSKITNIIIWIIGFSIIFYVFMKGFLSYDEKFLETFLLGNIHIILVISGRYPMQKEPEYIETDFYFYLIYFCIVLLTVTVFLIRHKILTPSHKKISILLLIVGISGVAIGFVKIFSDFF